MCERFEYISMNTFKRVCAVAMSTMLMVLVTACNHISEEDMSQSANTIQDTTTENSTTKDTTNANTTIDESSLIPFENFSASSDENGSYVTITQSGMEDCYWVISLLHDGQVLEYVSGNGYLNSEYGKFANDDSNTSDSEDTEQEVQNDDTQEDTTEVTTNLDDVVSKDGTWTFKCVSEGTEYLEIDLINKAGDVRSKCQYTCIVDAHLEAHMYYTNINY